MRILNIAAQSGSFLSLHNITSNTQLVKYVISTHLGFPFPPYLPEVSL